METARIECSKECIFIANKRAEQVKSFTFIGNYLVISGIGGAPIDGARLNLEEQIYAILYYDKLKIISLVIKRPMPIAITLVFRSGADYDNIIDILRITATDVNYSKQNFKISSYANNIVSKLNDGVELTIVDAVDKKNVTLCPECGTEVQPGAMYCMECGAEL